MIGPHTYKHLDKDSKLEVRVELQDVVKKIVSMNYGVQRFLSHLVDERRKIHNERIAAYQERGEVDIALRLTKDGDPMAEGINKLLETGLF